MATTNRSPYEILGVDSRNNSGNISLAYRNRVLEYTADRRKSRDRQKIGTQQFSLVCRAYETLIDPKKREQYDRTKQWTSYIPPEHYTLQQFVSEPDFAEFIDERFQSATLKDINDQDPKSGQTLLYCASRVCNLRAAEFLIHLGADPDIKQQSGSTALHVSAYYGHSEVVKFLLECGADYTQKNKYGNTAEQEAVGRDTEQCFINVKMSPYVQTAANQLNWLKTQRESINEHIDFQYYTLGQTLLHCASKKGHLDLMKWLVEERHANLDIIDINSNSALHLAAFAGHKSAVEYLLDHGANPLLINKWGVTAEQEGLIHRDSITRIFKAIHNRDMFTMAAQGIYWWFEYYFRGTDPNSVNSAGANLLYLACRHGHTELAQWLIENGANINIQLQDKSRSTPLHGAVYYNHIRTVETLLWYGADTQIRNGFGSSPFDDANSSAVKQLLRQYRQNLKENRVIPVHIFGDGKKSGELPLCKVQLTCDSNFDDLLQSIAKSSKENFSYFSIARRPLNKETNDIMVISAVCRARNCISKFVELPLCLIGYELARYCNAGHVMRNDPSSYTVRQFHKKFLPKAQSYTLTIEPNSDRSQQASLGNLSVIFPAKCVPKHVKVTLSCIFKPDPESFDLPGCICLFETSCDDTQLVFNETPSVSVTNASDAKLYTWTKSSPYWFTDKKSAKCLPFVGGIHAFIKHIDIIPAKISLPGDMFIQGATGQPLIPRTKPVSCQALKIREHNVNVFPHIAYHGTRVEAIASILMDGLVMPSTVVSSGIRVSPPSNHFARGDKHFGIDDFANGIFLTPSIYYCSDPCYAVTFSHDDQVLIAILECGVKSKSYKAFQSTVSTYIPHPSDNKKELEWRLGNTADLEILSVLFIPMHKSKTEAARKRAKVVGSDPNSV